MIDVAAIAGQTYCVSLGSRLLPYFLPFFEPYKVIIIMCVCQPTLRLDNWCLRCKHELLFTAVTEAEGVNITWML